MSPKQLELFQLPDLKRGASFTFEALRYPVWTENKARLIQRYLYYFVLITRHGAYIDGFAGPQSPEHPESWAAKQVLESEPRWLRSFFLCDVDPEKIRALETLRKTQPHVRGRSIEIFAGDFNKHVKQILASQKIREKTATFCLLDQRTFECSWASVQAIAKHKSATKVEIFYFVATGWLHRALKASIDPRTVRRISDWWGNSSWTVLKDLSKERISDAFCRRFRDELNYKSAFAWPIYERAGGAGQVMYHMIHATDHIEAPHLMARAYRQATRAPEPKEQLELAFAAFQDSRRS